MPAPTSSQKPAPVAVDPLHVHLLAGPNKGVRTVHHQPVVSFGREGDNDVVIEEAFVSRRHGEFRYDNGRWFIVNQSPNGTIVGKRVVKDKPRAIMDGEQVSIGDVPVLRVHIAERAGVTAPLPTATAEERPTGEIVEETRTAKMSGRKKLWLIIGGWWIVLLLGVAFYATLDRGGTKQRTELPTEWTSEQIAREIDQPLPKGRTDELQAKDLLREANELYPHTGTSRRRLYQAYDAYRNALALTSKDSFDGIDDLQFRETRKRMAETIEVSYTAGYSALRAGALDDALRSFNDILDFYPDTRSALYHHVEALKRAAVGPKRR